MHLKKCQKPVHVTMQLPQDIYKYSVDYEMLLLIYILLLLRWIKLVKIWNWHWLKMPKVELPNYKTERFNRTIIRMIIKVHIKGRQRDQDLYLGCLAAAYRATHESTGFTPNLLMLGWEVWLPAKFLFGSGISAAGDEVSSYGDYMENIQERLQPGKILVKLHRGRKVIMMKKCLWYNIILSYGLVFNRYWPMGVTPNLPYQGPYLVLTFAFTQPQRFQFWHKWMNLKIQTWRT